MTASAFPVLQPLSFYFHQKPLQLGGQGWRRADAGYGRDHDILRTTSFLQLFKTVHGLFAQYREFNSDHLSHFA